MALPPRKADDAWNTLARVVHCQSRRRIASNPCERGGLQGADRSDRIWAEASTLARSIAKDLQAPEPGTPGSHIGAFVVG
jgi:hypothetical protein